MSADRRYLNAVTYVPEWRSKEARFSDEPSGDPYVLRYRAFLKNPTTNEDFPIHVAHDIYRTDWFRSEVEAYLMAGALHEEVAERYDVSSEAVECYTYLFFDMSPLKGDGSRKRIANDPSVSAMVRKARQFGFRYGKLFIDWYSARLSKLPPEKIGEIDLCIEAVLRMKIVDIDRVSLQDNNEIGSAVKLLDALTRYREASNKQSDDAEVNKLMDGLRAMIHTSATPQGLPVDVFDEHRARPVKDA